MQVTDEMIHRLADLSALEFSGSEMPQVRSDLQKMIAFVEKLNELDLDQADPLLHGSAQAGVYREDRVEGQLERDEAFKNAAMHDGKFFKVPKAKPGKA